MKRILICLILLTPLLVEAQFSYIRKAQTIGCYNNDVYSDHIIDKNGDIVLAGYIASYTSSSCSLATTNSTVASFDGWIAKVDTNWNIKWSKSFGGSKEDRLLKIAACSEGYIAIGFSTSSDGDITKPNKGYHDYWVIRVNDNGDKLWSATFGSSSPDAPYDVIETSDKGFIIVGSLGMNDGDAAGLGIKGSNDAWIMKLNAAGSIVWQKTYGSSKSDYAKTITQISGKSYILCGRATAADGDLTGNNGAADMWVFKITDNGSLVWSKNMGGSGTEVANCVLKNSSGDLMIGAASGSADKDLKSNNGGLDYWLVKLDTNGNLYWQKNYGGSDDDYLNSIVESKEGGYLLTGSSLSNDKDAVGNHGLYSDILAVKIDDTGKIEWRKMYGGSSGEAVGKCYQIKDSSYVFVATTNSGDGDISKSNGLLDAWFVKLNRQAAAGISQYDMSGIKVYPTITSGTVNVATDEQQLNKIKIAIANTTGQLINVYYREVATGFTYDFSALPKGMYFITIATQAEQRNFRIVVQ